MANEFSFDNVLLNTRDNLAYLLKAGNLTLTALSELLGVSKAYISRWISGDTIPSFKAVVGVCSIFEVPLYEFCSCNIQKSLNSENIHINNVSPKNDDDALALAMFQSLSEYDRETVLRTMQSFCSNDSASKGDFAKSVLPLDKD